VSRGERTFFAGSAALIGFALAYALPIYARLPHHFYDPLARQWLFTRTTGPIPMGYVGQILWAIGGALAAAGVTWAIAGRAKSSPSDRAFVLASAWALTALAIVLGYLTWNNWP
jgi:hypothetical protein